MVYIGYQMVTWPMASRDPEKSNSWPQYAQSAISRKWLERETVPIGLPIGNGIWGSGHVIDDVTWPPKVLWGSAVGYPSDSLASCSHYRETIKPRMYCINSSWFWNEWTTVSLYVLWCGPNQITPVTTLHFCLYQNESTICFNDFWHIAYKLHKATINEMVLTL